MRKNHYAKNELCQQKYQSHIGKLLDHGLECRFCDASFGFKEDLIGHMRIHSMNMLQNFKGQWISEENFLVHIFDFLGLTQSYSKMSHTTSNNKDYHVWIQNWKKLLGFRHMQENLQNDFSYLIGNSTNFGS